ncbi:unnamed protein product [Spirodela intermedia]|uniref:Uncharacterized protein n=1 Tax=Spirodela intermedia TaxID=51605 RepID=A0A7I8IGR6_SPIIN|nr:unnamed protein product [Spirodela intermedia]CAA2616811.1 unnamed protein product [Spirodela intermedia]CAA6656484.1 unnamed protein product [Spirodela intermedia]CAA6656485.1 unnamed protein product [Spirodela intermedia]
MGLASLRSNSGKVSRHSLKFEKRKHFYENVKKVAVSLSATKTISKKKRTRSRQKKLKAYDLSALSATLPDENSPPPQQDGPTAKLKFNCKSRTKLVEREGKQLQAVFSHPAFQSDPVAAIRQHLESTQPLVSKPAKKDGEGKRSTRKRRQRSTGVKSMET